VTSDPDFFAGEPSPPAREREGGRLVLIMLLGLLALLGAGYAALYFTAGDKMPRGTTISGIEVGGLTRAQAEQALDDGLEQTAAEPIEATVGDESVTIQPEEAGLSVDVDASLDQAGAARSWSPEWLWRYFTGGEDLDAVVAVDDPTMSAYLEQLSDSHGRPARDGSVSFDGTQVRVRQALSGSHLDLEASRDALVEGYLSGDPVDLPVVTELPDIDGADVRSAVDGFANPAVSAPITLRFGKARVVLGPAEFTSALSLEPEDGTLVPQADPTIASALVDQSISGDGAPVDATVELVGGKPRVVPAKPGVAYQPADVADVMLRLVVREPGKRVGRVRSSVAKADFTTKDARRLRIKEKVSSFTTYYPYAEYRNVNIGRAAELVNGTVLKPGETFSLNGIVGERTRANGFTEGFIISNGVFKEDLGGGVSQLATTTFNAMFFAGLKDIEHKPHSFYIDRYPVGREATVAWGAVDLRFQNDTPNGVLVEAHVKPSTPSSQGVVTVSMWSTKYWDITTRTGDRYNLTQPATRTLTTSDCYPNTGYGGFDIDVWRYFRKPGSSTLVRTEKFHTHYIPSDTVICKKPANG
jgi:vancomycin resistance protein YoaR